MVTLPIDKAVTDPLTGFIVATAGLLLDQIPPGTLEVRIETPPTQRLWAPLNRPGSGGAVTEINLVAMASGHPPEPVTV